MTKLFKDKLQYCYLTYPDNPCKCKDGITPHIDESTGNWFIGEEDTGVHAQGPQGEPGKDGECDCDNVKVTVCHNGQDLEIPISALDAHLKHGDTLGPCPIVTKEKKK